ncbi:hypothetical protein [Streptomyces sp. NPDC050528]|uniref:hypothetical protein n=1 Tax=unclassified Streptomyces TaxID=2593676 RepID=UPI0037B5F84F
MPSTIPPDIRARSRPPGRSEAADIGLQATPLPGRTYVRLCGVEPDTPLSPAVRHAITVPRCAGLALT